MYFQENATELERSTLSQEVERLRNQFGMRQIDVSHECGLNASMLSQWMQGRYKGNVARLNRMMNAWITQRNSGKKVVPMSKEEAQREAKESPLKLQSELLQKRLRIDKKATLEMLKHRKTLYKYPKKCIEDACSVPIRLDIDLAGKRLIDSFLWNIYEEDYSYERFAKELAQDMDLPDKFYQPIAKSIRDQVNLQSKSMPWTKAVKEESLHPISLNIRLRDTILRDQFEWDLNDPKNCPDAFARTLCQDLGLGGDFESAISLSIREQLGTYSKLILHGHGNRVSKISAVEVALRSIEEAETWQPRVFYLNADDITMLEREDYTLMKSVGLTHPTINTKLPMSSTSGLSPKSPVSPSNSDDKPPKHVNTFLIFCRKWRKDLMAKYPNQTAKEISCLLGEKWKQMTAEQRHRYQPLADLENARRLKDWQQRQKLKQRSLAGRNTSSSR